MAEVLLKNGILLCESLLPFAVKMVVYWCCEVYDTIIAPYYGFFKAKTESFKVHRGRAYPILGRFS